MNHEIISSSSLATAGSVPAKVKEESRNTSQSHFFHSSKTDTKEGASIPSIRVLPFPSAFSVVSAQPSPQGCFCPSSLSGDRPYFGMERSGNEGNHSSLNNRNSHSPHSYQSMRQNGNKTSNLSSVDSEVMKRDGAVYISDSRNNHPPHPHHNNDRRKLSEHMRRAVLRGTDRSSSRPNQSDDHNPHRSYFNHRSVNDNTSVSENTKKRGNSVKGGKGDVTRNSRESKGSDTSSGDRKNNRNSSHFASSFSGRQRITRQERGTSAMNRFSLMLLPSVGAPLYSIVPPFSALVSSTLMKEKSPLFLSHYPENNNHISQNDSTCTMTADTRATRREDSGKTDTSVTMKPISPSDESSSSSGLCSSSSLSFLSVLSQPMWGSKEMDSAVFTLSSLHRLLQDQARWLSRQCRYILSGNTTAFPLVFPSHSLPHPYVSSYHRFLPNHVEDVEEKKTDSPAMTPKKCKMSEPELPQPSPPYGEGATESKRLKRQKKQLFLPSQEVVFRAITHLQQLLRCRFTASRMSGGAASVSCMSNTTSTDHRTDTGNNRKGMPPDEKAQSEQKNMGDGSNTTYLLPAYGLRYSDAVEVLLLLQFLSWYCLESTAIQLEASKMKESRNNKDKKGMGFGGISSGAAATAGGGGGGDRISQPGGSSVPSSTGFFFSSPVAPPSSFSRFSSTLGRRPVLPDDFLAPSVAIIRGRKNKNHDFSAVITPTLSFLEPNGKEAEDRFGGLWYRNDNRSSTSSNSSFPGSKQEESEHAGGSTTGGHVDPIVNKEFASTSLSSSLCSSGTSSLSQMRREEGETTIKEAKETEAQQSETEQVVVEVDSEDEEEEESEDNEIDSSKLDVQCAERLFTFLLGEELLTHLAKATAECLNTSELYSNVAIGGTEERGGRGRGRAKGREKSKEEMKKTLEHENVHPLFSTDPSPALLLISLHFYTLVLLSVALLRFEPVANGIFLSRLFSPVDMADFFFTRLPSHLAPSLSSSNSAFVSSKSVGSSKEEREPAREVLASTTTTTTSSFPKCSTSTSRTFPSPLPYRNPRHALLFPFLYHPLPSIRWAAGLTLQHLLQYLSCFHIGQEPLPLRRLGGGSNYQNPSRFSDHQSDYFSSSSSLQSFVPLSVQGGKLLLELHSLVCWLISANEGLDSASTPSLPQELLIHAQKGKGVQQEQQQGEGGSGTHRAFPSLPLRSPLNAEGLELLSPPTRPLLLQLLVTLVTITPYRRCPASLSRVRAILSFLSNEQMDQLNVYTVKGFKGTAEKVEEEEKIEGKVISIAESNKINNNARENKNRKKGDEPRMQVTEDHLALLDNFSPHSPQQHLIQDTTIPTTSTTTSSSLLSPTAIDLLRNNLCRQGAVAFVAQCICRLQPIPSSPTVGAVEGAGISGGGNTRHEQAKDTRGTIDMRAVLLSRKGSEESLSLRWQSSDAPQGKGKSTVGWRRGSDFVRGDGSAEGEKHHPQNGMEGQCQVSSWNARPEDHYHNSNGSHSCTAFSNNKSHTGQSTTLCDALVGVTTFSSLSYPSSEVSSSRKDKKRRNKKKGKEGENEVVEEEKVKYIFSSVDWLCMTAIARFFPDLIGDSPLRFKTLLQQTIYAVERFAFYHYMSSSIAASDSMMKEGETSSDVLSAQVGDRHLSKIVYPLLEGDTTLPSITAGVPMIISTPTCSATRAAAAAAAAALSEALRCWIHFIGYVWMSFDGKSDDVALHHHLSPVVPSTLSSSTVGIPPPPSSRVSTWTKCVLCRQLFLPIWRLLLFQYKQRQEYEKSCRIPSTASPKEEEDATADKDQTFTSFSSPTTTTQPQGELPPVLPAASVVKKALRAAANLSEECVVMLRETSLGNTQQHPDTSQEGGVFSFYPFFTSCILPLRGIRSDNSSDRDDVEEVMVAFVRHCAEDDPREMVRVEALQTFGVWCWTYPSLDKILLREDIFSLLLHSLRTEVDENCRVKAAWALSNLCVRIADVPQGGVPTTTGDSSPSSAPGTRVGNENGLPSEEDQQQQEEKNSESKGHNGMDRSSFSLREQPEVMQCLCEAALCATSMRIRSRMSTPCHSPSSLRHPRNSSFLSPNALNSVVNHGVRMMRGLLQVLSVDECVQTAVKCSMIEAGADAGEGCGRIWKHDYYDHHHDRNRNGIDDCNSDDKEEEEVLIEAFLSRLSEFLAVSWDVKVRWNAAMALGVALRRIDIFEAEPAGASSAILLLCDVLKRDTFFKVRIRVVEALSGVCQEGLKGEYSGCADFTPTVVDALCVALQKCQKDPPSHSSSLQNPHPHPSVRGATDRGMANGCSSRTFNSSSSSSLHEHGMGGLGKSPRDAPTPPLRASSSMVDFSSAKSSSSRSPALALAMEQGKEELRKLILVTIERILHTANPSIALDRVLVRNNELLQREEIL